MNHKRRRPKSSRDGCLMCKPWKANHAKRKRPFAEVRVATCFEIQGE